MNTQQTILDAAKAYAHDVAVDTAMVAACFVQTYPKADVLPYMDTLARAGQALCEVEACPAFIWEAQCVDFESCCQQLAKAVSKNPNRKYFVPVVKTILDLP